MEEWGEKEQCLSDIVGLFLDNYQGDKPIGIDINVAEGFTSFGWYELGDDGEVSLRPIKDRRLVSKLALQFWELSGSNYITLYLAVDPASKKFVVKMEKDDEQFRASLLGGEVVRQKLQTLADRL